MKFIEESFPGERKLTFRQRQHWLAKYQKFHRDNPTRAECEFAHILFELGLSYIPQKGVLMPPRFALIDFYLPKPYKLCIEIDGASHRDPEQLRRDNRHEVYLHRKGYRVLRFWNDEVFNQKEAVKESLLRVLSGAVNA